MTVPQLSPDLEEDRLIQGPHITPLPREEFALESSPPTNSGRVLVVDDEPGILALVQEILRHEGYTTGAALNGYTALSMLSEGWEPDLLIIDLMMPGMPGSALIQSLKVDHRYHQIPIIAMSAGLNLRNLGLEKYQPDALLPKPFDVDALIAQVRHLLRKQNV